jgi:hypothetical protein
MLNQSQVALGLGLHQTVVARMMGSPALTVFKLGRERRVRLENLLDYVVASTGKWGLTIGEKKAPVLRLEEKDPNYDAWTAEREAMRAIILDNLANVYEEFNPFVVRPDMD